MNFDFNWFLTVPGMLITGGVVLLIAALVLLIATSGKKNKENQEVEESSADTNDQAVAEQNAEVPMPEAANADPVPDMGQPQVNPNDSIMNIPDPVVAAAPADMNAGMDANPVAVEQPAITPEVTNDQPVMEPVADTPVMEQPMDANAVSIEQPAITPEVANDQPVMEPVADTPVMEQPAIQPVTETPSMEPVMEQPAVTPEVTNVDQPVMESNSVPNIDNNAEVQAPVVDANPTVADANPVQPAQPEQPQIYGGANPLENTQSIPISNIVGPNANQAPAQAPAAEPTMVEPQIQPVQPNIQQ